MINLAFNFLLFFTSVSLLAQDSSILSNKNETLLPKKSSDELIAFQYDNEELVNVINFIGAKKEINLLLPTKAEEKIVGKLTWHLDKKVTINQAWDLLQTILDIAGYSVVPRPTYFEIVKNNTAISREPVPLYIGVPPEHLPTGNQRIRFIYYLSNIKTDGDSENEISTTLKSLLPADTVYKIDGATNALILMGQAEDIRSAMSVITHLDRPGFQEQMEIIKLHYTESKMVADLFNNKILQSPETNRYRLDSKKPSDATYFSKHLKIIANERTNSLIVLGRQQALERIRAFINHYIDVEPDSGRSILHVYQLQYLDAPTFAKVLQNIVQSKQGGGTEQATGAQKGATGPQRYFDEVIISVDTPEGGAESFTGGDDGDGQKAIAQAKYHGGNKLIIACRNDDWKRLKELIEKLDQPSPQVLIEVLIADLTLDDSRALGTLFRNPSKIPMPGQVNFQSAMLQPGVMTDSFSDPQTVGAIDGGASSDLLRQFNNSDPRQDTGDPLTNVAQLLQAGSSVLSFSDNSGKTWGISQILKLLDHTKILSHPHVISTNNQKAKIEITETRVLRDQASGSQGGTIVQTRKQVPASLKVNIIPRISISDIREHTVSLNVTIDIDEYKSNTDNTRITRKVQTNATVNTGDILALGGLIRSNESDSLDETPVLSKVPVIGWLFKRRARTKQRTNLTVFISPTIIEPRLRGGIGDYTKDYLDITRTYAGTGGLFDSLKDPVTRWFFAEENPTDRFTQDFLKHDEVHRNEYKTPMPKAPRGKNKSLAKNSKELPPISDQEIGQQLAELKELLKDIDNPFENVNQNLAKNEAIAPQEQKSKRSKKKSK